MLEKRKWKGRQYFNEFYKFCVYNLYWSHKCCKKHTSGLFFCTKIWKSSDNTLLVNFLNFYPFSPTRKMAKFLTHTPIQRMLLWIALDLGLTVFGGDAIDTCAHLPTPDQTYLSIDEAYAG